MFSACQPAKVLISHSIRARAVATHPFWQRRDGAHDSDRAAHRAVGVRGERSAEERRGEQRRDEQRQRGNGAHDSDRAAHCAVEF